MIRRSLFRRLMGLAAAPVFPARKARPSPGTPDITVPIRRSTVCWSARQVQAAPDLAAARRLAGHVNRGAFGPWKPGEAVYLGYRESPIGDDDDWIVEHRFESAPPEDRPRADFAELGITGSARWDVSPGAAEVDLPRSSFRFASGDA